MSENKGKKLKKKLKAGMLALAAAAAVLVHMVTPAAKDVIWNEPPAIVSVIDEGEELNCAEEEKKVGKRGLKARLRAFLARLPLAVRLLLILPLWAIGALLTAGAGMLGKMLRPVFGFLLKWLVIAAVFFGILLLLLKLIFPQKSFRELLKLLLKKKNLLLIAAASLLLTLADTVLPLCLEDYRRVKTAVVYFLGLLFLLLLLFAFLKREKKKFRLR